MTNREAIEIITQLPIYRYEEYSALEKSDLFKALKMAVDALGDEHSCVQMEVENEQGRFD